MTSAASDKIVDYKAFFEAVPGLYLILLPNAPHYTIVAVSNSYLQATMTKRDEITGRGLFEVFPDNPDDPSATGTSNLKSSLEKVLGGKIAHTMAIQKYDIQRPEASGGGFEERYWSPLNTPVLNDKKEITYIIHQVEDVTELIRHQQKDAKQVIAIEKASYIEKRMNDFMEVLLKFTLMDFSVKAEVGNKGDELDAIAVGLNTLSEELEAEIKRRQKYEKELEIKSKQLEISNKDLEYFAYIASHDLQEPLRMISSFLQLLEKKLKNELDQDALDYIGFAVNGAKRMKNMIDDLLSYSRVISKKVQFENVNTNEILKEILFDLSEKIKETKATISNSTLPEIIADKVKITRLFQNLLCNALKFSREGVPLEISVEYEERPEEYLFWIKDNGIGIKKEYSQKIFLLFQRLNRSENVSGTGIGLAECKKIVELHGGKIWVESELNKGAIFYFTINKKIITNP
jgi:signal transduction histidine kinase